MPKTKKAVRNELEWNASPLLPSTTDYSEDEREMDEKSGNTNSTTMLETSLGLVTKRNIVGALHQDLRGIILSFLHEGDLILSLSAVSNMWREDCLKERLWIELCERDFARRRRFRALLNRLKTKAVTTSLEKLGLPAGIDRSWTRTSRKYMWRGLYRATPRIRWDGYYFLKQTHVSARDRSWVDETTMTDEDFEESWKPVVRPSYRYFRFYPSGRVHFLQHIAPPDDDVISEISRSGPRSLRTRSKKLGPREVQHGSYRLAPKKRSIEVKILQERHIMHFVFEAVAAKTNSSCFTRLYVREHHATSLATDGDSSEEYSDGDSCQRMEFNMHKPYEYYRFVRCSF